MAEVSDPGDTALRTVPAKIRSLLKQLHKQSLEQENAIAPTTMQAIRSKIPTDLSGAKAAMDELMLDKFIALDEDKSHFMYNIMLAQGSRNVIEIGTSFGVSTIYLALAVNENLKRFPGTTGTVIGTEKEPSKAEVAQSYWKEAGSEVENLITLREGDLTEVLANPENLPKEPIDFVLMDIWPYVALPALELLKPHLRPGAVILTDNVISSSQGYTEYLRVLNDPAGPFNNVVLPFKGGFQMSVFMP